MKSQVKDKIIYSFLKHEKMIYFKYNKTRLIPKQVFTSTMRPQCLFTLTRIILLN